MSEEKKGYTPTCTRMKSCIYGITQPTPMCNYYLIEGKRHNYPSSECTAYKKGKRKARFNNEMIYFKIDRESYNKALKER